MSYELVFKSLTKLGLMERLNKWKENTLVEDKVYIEEDQYWKEPCKQKEFIHSDNIENHRYRVNNEDIIIHGEGNLEDNVSKEKIDNFIEELSKDLPFMKNTLYVEKCKYSQDVWDDNTLFVWVRCFYNKQSYEVFFSKDLLENEIKGE